MYIYIHIPVYKYINIHVYIYIYIYIQWVRKVFIIDFISQCSLSTTSGQKKRNVEMFANLLKNKN